MSAIDKKPFIIRALETLSDEQLTELKRLVNGGSSEALTGGNFRSLINPDFYVTENDVGIHEITLEISRNRAQNLYKGYLVYNIVSEVEYYCFLIYYSTPDQQTIGIVKIEPNGPHSTYLFCNPLTILELRSEINDILGVGEAEIERYIENDKKVLEKVVFDTEAGTTTFPKYILPLKIIVRKSGGTFTSLFFDYESGYVINNSGSQTNITIEHEDQSVVVNSTSWSNKMIAIEYINFYGGLSPSISGLNAYNLYHSQGGSRMYTHILTTNLKYCNIVVISNVATQMTGSISLNSPLLDFIFNNVHSIDRCQKTTSATRKFPIFMYYYSGELSTRIVVEGLNTDNNTRAFEYITEITADTVTEL